MKKSTSDTGIESLDRKRKNLRQKANKTLKDKANSTNYRKKKRRRRARRKRKELMQGTLKGRKGPRQIHNDRNIQIIMSMRKESGGITSDREDVLTICTDFSLYPNSVHTGRYNEINSRHRRNTRVLRRRSGKSRKKDIKTQSSWRGWNYIWYYKNKGGWGGGGGRQIVLTYLANICNSILKTRQIPDRWHGAKTAILFKKGDSKDIKKYGTISLLLHR